MRGKTLEADDGTSEPAPVPGPDPNTQIAIAGTHMYMDGFLYFDFAATLLL